MLAFAGVVLVIWPGDASARELLRGLSMADGLALLGGFMFALTNVTLRRLHGGAGAGPHVLDVRRLHADGAGGGRDRLRAGVVEPFPAPNIIWMATAALLAGLLLLGNWALQFGASRLAAGTTAIVMLSEVVFASVSSVLLSAAALQPRTLLGGGMIVLAALLASPAAALKHQG